MLSSLKCTNLEHKSPASTEFSKIPRKRRNSAETGSTARLKIPWSAENCGSYQSALSVGAANQYC